MRFMTSDKIKRASLLLVKVSYGSWSISPCVAYERPDLPIDRPQDPTLSTRKTETQACHVLMSH
jgi:hypothetical protein